MCSSDLTWYLVPEKSTDVNDDSQDDVTSMEKIMDFFGEGLNLYAQPQQSLIKDCFI